MTVLGENIILQAVLAAVVLFLAKSQVYSRYFLFVYYVLLLASLIAWRALLRLFLARRQKKGHSLSHILVIGNSPLALSFAETVEANRHMGYRLVGFIAAAPDPQMGDRYLGEIDRLDALLAADGIDEVIFASSRVNSDELGRVIAICGRYPVQVRIIPYYSRYHGRALPHLALRPLPAFFRPRRAPRAGAPAFAEKGLRPAGRPAGVPLRFLLAVAPAGAADQGHFAGPGIFQAGAVGR